MPSPVGHALGGIAAGFLVAGVPSRGGALDRGAAIRQAAVFAAVAVAPDLDLLVGAHSGPTHGLGAALLVGVIAFAGAALVAGPAAARRGRPQGPPLRIAMSVAAAYGSHTLLDWLGHDSRAPIGIMALWPFTRDYYESSLRLFMGVSRRYWLPGFWQHNAVAVLRELAILVPVVAAVLAFRRRGTKGRTGQYW